MNGSAEDRLVAVWRQEGPRIFRALVATTGHRAIAEDAIGEAFAQALARGTDLRDPGRWIWRVSFRIAAGEMKDRRRVTGMGKHDLPVEDPETLSLLTILHQLPTRQRTVIVLHYYAGYGTAEIARILGTSPTTVRVHLSVGRARLRRLLEDEDD